MAKKKKKSPSSPHPGTPSTPSQARKNLSVELETVDRLLVRVATSSTANHKRTPSSRWTPTLKVSEPDAQRLNIVQGSHVFVLPKNPSGRGGGEEEESGNVVGCIICKAEIAFTSTRSATSLKQSPVTPKSPVTSGRSSLSPGTIQIRPSSVCEFLFPQDSTNSDSSDAVSTSVLTPSKAALSTPPQPTVASEQAKPSPFSFHDFVEQHDLASTPSTPASARRSGSQKQSSGRSVWIIPVDSGLGQIILERVPIKRASEIQVRLPKEFALPKTCHIILEQLVRATHMNRLVQTGEPIPTSFQGRTMELCIRSIETTPLETKDLSTLEEAFGELKLQYPSDMDNMDDDADLVTKQIVSSLQTSKLHLYQICRETKVKFTSSEESDSAESKEENETIFVAGLSSVVQHVREHLLIPLTRPDLFTRANPDAVIQPPRGILLHGPSGVGKTCLAKQIAQDLQRNSSGTPCLVEFVNCVSLQSKTSIVGEAERVLSRYFRPSSAPKLMIFDDIHLICSKRGGIGGTTDQLAATLLAMMDGVGKRGGEMSCPIAILAITNDPNALDPALRRPGRLDYEVEVPLPDEPSKRAEIFRFHLEKMTKGQRSLKLSEEELMELGKNAKGFNGADCLLAVKEAIRLSVRRHGSSSDLELTMKDLENAIKSIRPSAIKAVTVEIPQVLWSDIGGMESVKNNLREAIEMPFAQQVLFEKLRIPPPRGILLYGPPGTGKTMIARALATEGKMNFLAVKGPELLSKWLGESERALASLFRRARMASPSIIFFDEIDAIATKRGSSDSTTGSRMLSQLLTELDGVVTTSSTAGSDNENKRRQRVVVVGATNRPDLLDSALTRPGRIDRMVYVGLPDRPSREKVFEVALKARACDPDVDLRRLADDEVSGGYSGAEIVGICREAALLALDEDDYLDDSTSSQSPSVKMRHLLKAVNLTKRQITQEMLDFYAIFRDG